MPKVSVIIHTYNNERFIAETIETVLAQTFKDYEIIVVDDGSTDNTRTALNPYIDRVKYHYKENGGIASAKNAGIKLSNGEYVAFLDHDDLWVPEKLDVQIDYFYKNPQVGLVYSKYASFRNGDGDVIRVKPKVGFSGWIFAKLISKSVIQTSTVMVRMDCLKAVGPFDESLALADEYDLFLRIAKSYQCGFINKELTRYRIHENNASKNRHLFDLENLKVYERLYGNYNDLSKKEERLLEKRIAIYKLNVARYLYSIGRVEESMGYRQEAVSLLPFYKRIFSNMK